MYIYIYIYKYVYTHIPILAYVYIYIYIFAPYLPSCFIQYPLQIASRSTLLAMRFEWNVDLLGVHFLQESLSSGSLYWGNLCVYIYTHQFFFIYIYSYIYIQLYTPSPPLLPRPPRPRGPSCSQASLRPARPLHCKKPPPEPTLLAGCRRPPRALCKRPQKGAPQGNSQLGIYIYIIYIYIFLYIYVCIYTYI